MLAEQGAESGPVEETEQEENGLPAEYLFVVPSPASFFGQGRLPAAWDATGWHCEPELLGRPRSHRTSF